MSKKAAEIELAIVAGKLAGDAAKDAIMVSVAKGDVSAAEGLALLGKLPSGNNAWKAKIQVSRNKSGGVFIRHPKFIEHSARVGKDYVAGINVPPNVAKVLFGDKSVFDEIAKLVLALPEGVGTAE